MKKKDTSNTGFRNGNLFCYNCGVSYDMHLPQPISMAAAIMEQFAKSHKNCKQTWTEPIVNPEKSKHERAYWWVQNGETGQSSKTMWGFFMGETPEIINHPHDPDDFQRCYKLLQAVPEWKRRMDELRILSPTWNALVDNWSKLTEMWEERLATGKSNGMYDLMKSIGC